MSKSPEAVRLNLEYYRKAAKSLLKAAQSGEPAALERIARSSPGAAEPPALHRAQLTIAREQGFASWPRFRAFLVESSLDFQALAAKFIDAALDDPRHAEEMLAQHPEIARAGLYVALVLGDAANVERAIGESPEMVEAKGGPRDWEPLPYVCFSRFAAARSGRAGDLAATARLLLAHGADPNAFYVDERYPDSPLPCLYGAAGLNNNAELTGLLLDAGARLDDGESLYHSTEHADLACFRLLLERGASPRATNVLHHMLDKEEMEGLRLLLAAGADPNQINRYHGGETSLHWAVWRGRSAAIVEALLDAGAAIDARGPHGRTAYAIAVQLGQTETAKLLASRGADTELSALDRFVGDCATAGPEELERLIAERSGVEVPAEYARLLPDLAASHCTAAVRALLAAGVPVDTRGEHGGTALHWACWKGYADLVKLLLDHGASLTVEDSAFHAPPAGWFNHGRENCGERDGDYTLTEQLLVDAGAIKEHSVQG
jgi:ankyrin repeat protein